MNNFFKKEDDANAQVRGKNLGVKAAGTDKPPKTDQEIPSNISLENTLKQLDNKIVTLQHIELRKFPNFVRTYPISNTSIAPLRFQNDTGNSPIVKVRVINIGAGLFLGFNGNEEFGVTENQEFEGEFNHISAYVLGGTGNIILFSRVDR